LNSVSKREERDVALRIERIIGGEGPFSSSPEEGKGIGRIPKKGKGEKKKKKINESLPSFRELRGGERERRTS